MPGLQESVSEQRTRLVSFERRVKSYSHSLLDACAEFAPSDAVPRRRLGDLKAAIADAFGPASEDERKFSDYVLRRAAREFRAPAASANRRS